jgi:hypothetical protein
MNRQSRSARRKLLLSKIMFSLVLATGSFAVSAQSVDKTDSLSSKNVVVKYLGMQDEMMLIAVSYKNPESSFHLAIYTSEGDLLFRDVYHVKMFDRKFRVPKEHGRLNFVFGGSDDKTSHTLELNSISKMTEEVVIKTPA